MSKQPKKPEQQDPRQPATPTSPPAATGERAPLPKAVEDQTTPKNIEQSDLVKKLFITAPPSVQGAVHANRVAQAFHAVAQVIDYYVRDPQQRDLALIELAKAKSFAVDAAGGVR